MKLTADNLKSVVWDTLQKVKSGKCSPMKANAIASQAREILRTTNTQISIIKTKEVLPKSIVDFAIGASIVTKPTKKLKDEKKQN